MNRDEALRRALEALYPISHNSTDDPRGQADKAIAAIREVLEQPQHELTCVCGAVWQGEELVSTPPRREWVGLSDMEEAISLMPDEIPAEYDGPLMDFARAIEAKLKEKNA